MYSFRCLYIYEKNIGNKMDLLADLKISVSNFNFVMIYIIHKTLVLMLD